MATTNLYLLGRWAENYGLVGEKQAFLTGACICASNKPIGFGIESPSGAGKTVAADLLLGDGDEKEGLVYSSKVYYKDAGSETSFFRDAAEINRKSIIFFRELQKDKTHQTVEAVKSVTEGKSAARRRVDVTKRQGEQVETDKISPKTVAYTLAIENDTKPDTELRRRCVSVATDVSKEQTGRVLELKAKMRFNRNCVNTLSESEAIKIRKDYNMIRDAQFRVINPFAQAFSSTLAEIAPDQKVRSVAEHFWDVMESVTKINYLTGRVAVGSDKKTLICNVQDLYQTLDIYKDSFIRDVYSIPPLGDIILQGFRDAEQVDQSTKRNDLVAYTSELTSSRWFDVNHLRKAIKEHQKVVLAKNVVIQICKQLVDAGYLEDYKDGSTVMYQVQEEFKKFENPEWGWLVEQASELVKDAHPDVFEKWHQQQWLSYTHPITGEEVKYGNE